MKENACESCKKSIEGDLIIKYRNENKKLLTLCPSCFYKILEEKHGKEYAKKRFDLLIKQQIALNTTLSAIHNTTNINNKTTVLIEHDEKKIE